MTDFRTFQLPVIRLVEELEECSKRLDQQEVREQFDRQHQLLDSMVSAYGGIGSEGATDAELKEASIIASRPLLEMIDADATFTTEYLVPSGLHNAVASNSWLLITTAYNSASYFRDPRVEAIRTRAPRDSVVRSLLEQFESEPISPNRVVFFSPHQMESDLVTSRDMAIEALQSLERHDTNWLKVGKGALGIGLGLFGKAAGAVACATGVGCVAGAAGIVSGTIGIIDGVKDIADGLSED